MEVIANFLLSQTSVLHFMSIFHVGCGYEMKVITKFLQEIDPDDVSNIVFLLRDTFEGKLHNHNF